MFKNNDVSSIFLKARGFKTLFGVVRVSPMKSLWAWMCGALGEWENTG